MMTPNPVSRPTSASMPHQPHGPLGSAMPKTLPNSQSTAATETNANETENTQPDFSTARSRIIMVTKPATANPKKGMLIAMKARPAETPRTRPSAGPRGKAGAKAPSAAGTSTTKPKP